MFRLIKSLLVFALLAMAPVATLADAPTDFALEPVGPGKTFTLSAEKGRVVALHFLLKTECPFCGKYTYEYATKGPNIAGLTQVFIKPDSASEIETWTRTLKVPVTIYRDADAKLADQFGVPGDYAFHGETVHFPATILIGPDGKEVFRYIGKSNADRLPYAKFAGEVAKAQGGSLKEYNLGKGNLAIDGYDPVSYFEGGKPTEGSEKLMAEFRGVTYHFSSGKNRELFLASPVQYVPTYGGWCATAMADGSKVEIDPENFKITNGRLFLFYKGLLGNAIKDWNKNEPESMKKADANWARIAGEK